MGFELNKSGDMRWLDMPDGVRIEVRPYTSVIEAQAEAWAARHLSSLADGADTAELLGLFSGDDAVNPDDLTKLLRDAGVAIHAISQWEGVTRDGDPVAPDAQSVWQWMVDPINRASFLGVYDTVYREARREGNASGLSPNGISAVAPNTANHAETTTSHAQEESGDTTANAAPIESISL